MSALSPLMQRAAAVAQVLVDDLEAPQLSDTDHHHLNKVLRVRNGETVVVTDGAGTWRLCAWNNGELVVTSELVFDDRLLPAITVGFALTKGDKPELVVQKLTEIGVDVIRPFVAAHTVVKWDADKAAANVERFRRVAYEAAMQSRRVWLPVVTDVVSFSELPTEDRVVAQAGGPPVSLDQPMVLVGPEGGWSPDELVTAYAQVGLGPTVLRAETAALSVAIQLADKRWQRSLQA